MPQRTQDYHRWLESFAQRRKIPIEWAQKDMRKEDYVGAHLRRRERQNRFSV